MNWTITGFRFSPKDRTTVAVLTTLGVPAAVIRSGHLSGEDMGAAKLSTQVFSKLSLINKDSPKDGYDYFSPNEAHQLKRLLRTNGPRVMPLFNPDTCPGKSNSAGDVLMNMLRRVQDHRIDDAVFTESTCPYVQDGPYSTADLVGIHYVDTMVPAGLQVFGKAVIAVYRGDGSSGSAVITSNEGDIYTAHHVLFLDTEVEGKLKRTWVEGSTLIIGGKTITLREDQIVDQDPERDLVHLRIPTLGPQPHLALAQQLPKRGDPLWVIGFPGQIPKDHKRTYTTGQFTKFYPTSGELFTDARVVGGNSGGAIINARGELLAITSCGCGTSRDSKQQEIDGRTQGYTLPDLYKKEGFQLELKD